jgi:hypothetical protein
MTTVRLHNDSAGHGGACTCSDWHVIMSHDVQTKKQHNLTAGQTQQVDLSKLGWDQYDGTSFQIAAKTSTSNWRHSNKALYRKGLTEYRFDFQGPDGGPSIAGPK